MDNSWECLKLALQYFVASFRFLKTFRTFRYPRKEGKFTNNYLKNFTYLVHLTIFKRRTRCSLASYSEMKFMLSKVKCPLISGHVYNRNKTTAKSMFEKNLSLKASVSSGFENHYILYFYFTLCKHCSVSLKALIF